MQGIKVLDVKKTTIIIVCMTVFLAQISEKTDNIGYMIIGYLMVFLWTVFNNTYYIFPICLFLLSDNSILDIGGISIQLLLMLIYLFKNFVYNNKKIYSKTFFYAMLISIYSLIYINLGISYALQGIKLAILIVFFTECFRNKDNVTLENYFDYIEYASFGLIFSLIIAIIVNPTIMLTTGRIALSEDSNWNMFGILSAILFSHNFLIYVYSNKKKNLFFSIVFVVYTVISTSRTALIVIIVSFLWNIFKISSSKKKNDLTKFLIIVIVVIVVGMIIFGNIHFTFTDKLIDRIINPRRGDVSNGRFSLWIGYINCLKNNSKMLIFGHGSPLVDGIKAINEKTSNVAHNLYIEQMVMYGIVGNIIIILLYLSSYNKIKNDIIMNNHSMNKKYMINIAIIFIVGIFSHLLTSVLVTTELYLGILQYMVFNLDKKE